MLLRRAFQEVQLRNPLDVVSDGQAAMDFLTQRMNAPAARLPALMILDLKMPGRTGLDVLKWKREVPVVCGLPVVVFSSSLHREDIEEAYAFGSNGFFVKPPSIGERREFASLIKQWMRLNQPPFACMEGYHAANAAYLRRRAAG